MPERAGRSGPPPPVHLLSLFVYGALWGALTIAGRGDRWAGPTFQVVREYGGGPTPWGLGLLLFCVAGLAGVAGHKSGRRTVTQMALVSAGIWSVAFGVCLAAAVAVNPQAALTGAATWGFHAWLFLHAARRMRWA